MNSRERVNLALNHQEPDQIPFDLGGTNLTSISIYNYNKFRAALSLEEVAPRVMDIFQQNTLVDEDLFEILECDVRPVFSELPVDFSYQIHETTDGYSTLIDEWGIGWKKPIDSGLYYDMYSHPLQGEITIDSLKSYPWPDPVDGHRFGGLRERAYHFAIEKKKAVTLDGFCSGIMEMASWLRGYSDFYMDIARDEKTLAYMLDKIVELKMAYWEKALQEVENNIDVVMEADDMAGQLRLLISPNTYRKVIKPRHKKLFQFIKDRTPAKLFFHSCGAIRPLIPDLMEIGVDILNPVQVNAAGMDSKDLKRNFGDKLCFWGGGVDTQGAFSSSLPRVNEVDNDVNCRIIDFKDGGGFIFAPIHNIQANVAPENIVAMWKKYRQLRVY